MTRNEFLTKVEQNGITLDESQEDHYYDLWSEHLRQCTEPVWNDRTPDHQHNDLTAFCDWIKRHYKLMTSQILWKKS